GLAIWTPLSRLCGGYHGVEQPEIGRTNAWVKPACDVVHHIVGVKHIAIGPTHTLTQFEGPGAQIFRGFPALSQVGSGDVIASGDGEIFQDVPRLVGFLSPIESGRIS